VNEYTSNLLERRIPVSKRNLKIKTTDPAPDIDWAAVDSAPLVDTPDDDSPELTAAPLGNLRPLLEVLPALSTGKTRINHAG